MIEPKNGQFVLPSNASWDRELKAVGAKWSARLSAWTLPGTEMSARTVNDLVLNMGTLSVPPVTPATVEDERLYPYQREAAARLAAEPHGLILVAAPGLGKTAISVAAAEVAVPDDKIVVVTLASLTRTWEREIRRWGSGEVYIFEGKPDYEAAAEARWIVASWDKMVREGDIWGRGWPLWILDESILTKSRASKRFKTLQKIRKNVDRFWLLSGSPTSKYADDLWAQLNLLWPRAFTSYWRFAERYCVIEDGPWARSVVGDVSRRSVADENRDLMLVISEDDAGLDLPEHLFEPPVMVDLRVRQAAAYLDMHDQFVAELQSGQQVVADNEISRLMQLQKIASFWDGESSKHDVLMELLEKYAAPFLVWTHWREGADALTARMQAAGLRASHVDGRVGGRARDDLIEGYKAGDSDALVLSLGVGKFGHTLTNTRTIISLDRNFNADDIFQSSHRVRRIGLTHRPVVVPIVARGTVDELTVGDNLEQKLTSISRLTRASLGDLLRGIGR